VDRLHILLRKSQPPGDGHRQLRNPFRVSPGVRVFRVDRGRERADRIEIDLPHLCEKAFVLLHLDPQDIVQRGDLENHSVVGDIGGKERGHHSQGLPLSRGQFLPGQRGTEQQDAQDSLLRPEGAQDFG